MKFEYICAIKLYIYKVLCYMVVRKIKDRMV